MKKAVFLLLQIKGDGNTAGKYEKGCCLSETTLFHLSIQFFGAACLPAATKMLILLDSFVFSYVSALIGVELFYDKFPVKIRNVMDVLNRIITLLVGAFFTVYGVRMVLSTMDSRLPVTKWPSSLMYIMIPVSGIAIIYFTVLDIMGLKEYKKTDDAGKFNREEEEKE